MQKLQEEFKNIPANASLVHSSISAGLNRDPSTCLTGIQGDESLSVPGKVLTCNNPEVNHRQHTGDQNLRVSGVVYVLNKRGLPLMPTTRGKSRKLLKSGGAKVVSAFPFTIRLLAATGEAKQPVTLGIDPGYQNVGFSAVTARKELISGQVVLRKDVVEKLLERRMYRRNRRNRLWHRKPRFLNRGKEGWLAPSIRHKLDAHIRLIERIKSLLPVSRIIIETASFDAQKMQNPEISGVEYQQGTLRGYEIREYLLEKWGRKCAYCGKKDIPLEIEHIVPKSRGGTNRVSNLTLSCGKCNQKKGGKTAEEFGHPNIQKKSDQSLKSAPFMNIVKTRLANLVEAEETLGYITKHNRIRLELEKSHANDAFIIAGGKDQKRTAEFFVGQKRRNNRCLQLNRKGFKPSIRRQRYSMQPGDLIKINTQVYSVKGVHSYGKQIQVKESGGKVLNFNIKLVFPYKFMKGLSIHPTNKFVGFLEKRS